MDIAYATSPFLKDIIPDESVLRNIAGLSEEEYRKIRPRTEAEAARLGVKDADSETMQRFFTALKDAGNVIETSFIKNLQTITPRLQELTTAVADTIARFLSSKEFAIWMDKAGKAIEDFVDYLTSPKAIDDFEKFTTAISNVANGLVNLATLLGLFPKTEQEQAEEDQRKAITLGGANNVTGLLKSGAQNVGDTSRSLVKNWYDYPLSTLTNLGKTLTTPIATTDTITNFFKASTANVGKLAGVNPNLAASIKAAGFDVESGRRTLEQENSLIAGYDKNGNPITAAGRPVGGAKSHHIPGEAVDVTMASLAKVLSKYSEQELKERFNLYAPVGKRDPNHLELWDKNRTDIYVNNPAGSGITVTSASQSGTQSSVGGR